MIFISCFYICILFDRCMSPRVAFHEMDGHSNLINKINHQYIFDLPQATLKRALSNANTLLWLFHLELCWNLPLDFFEIFFLTFPLRLQYKKDLTILRAELGVQPAMWLWYKSIIVIVLFWTSQKGFSYLNVLIAFPTCKSKQFPPHQIHTIQWEEIAFSDSSIHLDEV